MIAARRRQIGIPARSLNGVLALWVGRLGWRFPRVVILRVHGRRSGRLYRVPLLVAHRGGQRYLVAARGQTAWAQNLACAGWGELIRGTRRERVTAHVIGGDERVDALHAYLGTFGWLNHRMFDVGRRPNRETVAQIAHAHTVFRLSPYTDPTRGFNG